MRVLRPVPRRCAIGGLKARRGLGADAARRDPRSAGLRREIEERKKSQRALEELAAIDPLTGVFNRRQFLLLAEREIREAAPSSP